MTPHRCHAQNCPAMVPHHIFMCARHWRMIPKPLQAAIREAWESGSDQAHRANSLEAVRVVAAAEGGRMMPGVTPGMKALTLWQPWASLIMIGAKPHEFRKWNFTDKPKLARLVDRRIVIHAGARPVKTGELADIIERIDEGESALVAEIARPFVEALLGGSSSVPMAAALGTAVIGNPQRSADLFRHIVADSDRLDQQMYAWPVYSIQPFPAPVPSAGAQGFWNWS
jgi:hypothetical protein